MEVLAISTGVEGSACAVGIEVIRWYSTGEPGVVKLVVIFCGAQDARENKERTMIRFFIKILVSVMAESTNI